MTRFVSLYDHDPRDTRLIEIAITQGGRRPEEEQWQPAYRDTMKGHKVVWVRNPLDDGDIWLRDEVHGVRKTKRWGSD